MNETHDLEIKQTYEWCIRAFSALKSRLGLNINFHHDEGQIEAGQIFLFNHFARLETIIPQYLIYQETGAYCRCVAAAELFQGSEKLAKFLLSVGAVPNDLPGLLPFLAAEILRGRKVIVFPEGGMIKDRRVVDAKGRYRVYSPTAHENRKHHKGPAVIALTLEVFKKRILSVHEAGDTQRLARWVQALGLESIEALLAAARRPTLVVPANITFYPIRIGDNILVKGAELFGNGLNPHIIEELVIEGNILLKDTDMDIRLGSPIPPVKKWRWWEKKVLARLFTKIESLDDLFELGTHSERWDERLFAMIVGREIGRLRDDCMHGIYSGVTVNLSHLASQAICMFAEKGVMEVEADLFHKTLYLAVKHAQLDPSLHLHKSIADPDAYAGLEAGRARGLEQFVASMESAGLIERRRDRYRFLPKLLEHQGFHEIRLENPISVYVNEMAPAVGAKKAVEKAMTIAPVLDDRTLALSHFEDELVAHAWDKQAYAKPAYAKINDQETATESGEPYLLLPQRSGGLGVVLVHGFLASPAELRGFADKLEAAGYPVLGVRLKGHGTSPWDLRDRSWQDWLESVRRGYAIMSALAERVCLVGFSSGAALSLVFASERPEALAGVAAVATPWKFRDRRLVFVPLVHGANKLTDWVPSLEGIRPFRPNHSEHPHINYRHMPLRGLYELRLMVDKLKRSLPRVRCPVVFLQGTEDHIVDPKSAEIIMGKIGSERKSLHMISSERHGILNEDIGDTHDTILSFLSTLADAPGAREC